MNSENKFGLAAYGIAAIGAFLIVAALAWIMYSSTRPEPMGTDRAKERREKLAALRAEDADVLNNYAWVDQGKGIVRLPIAQAMSVAAAQWAKGPTVVRSNLVARVEKATKPVTYE